RAERAQSGGLHRLYEPRDVAALRRTEPRAVGTAGAADGETELLRGDRETGNGEHQTSFALRLRRTSGKGARARCDATRARPRYSSSAIRSASPSQSRA